MPSYYFNERFYIVYNINLIMFYDLLIFIFMSYIKPQLVDPLQIQNLGCISYYSYIKPQQFVPSVVIWLVVYRTIPTSNHNWVDDNKQKIAVVYRTIPTSNHNWHEERPVSITLYIVLFLHQTTTSLMYCCCSLGCISYYSYIKPQHIGISYCFTTRCISYYSYIKPQPIGR